jgi:hypothetical protein
MTDDIEIKKNRPPTDIERQMMFMDFCFRTGWNGILEMLCAVLYRNAAQHEFKLEFVSKALPDCKITIEHKKLLIKV